MKILMLTDFSKCSKIALNYAVGFSKDIDVELTILHIIDTNTPAMARLSSKKLGQAIKTSAEQDMTHLVETITKENPTLTKISSKIIFGAPIEKEVETFALQNDIEIVCLGTKGITGIQKFILGSNALRIMEHCSVPVLAIPEFAQYNGIKQIVYSSDLINLDEELASIIPLAKLLKSHVHILHIQKENEDIEADLQLHEKRLKIKFAYQPIKVKALKGFSIVEGINQYVTNIQADMVAMFTHHTSFFEKIFNKSITQKTAFQTKTPLLTFQKG